MKKLTKATPAILALLALALGAQPKSALAAEGEDVFNTNCALCHATDASTTKLGPSLAGVVGRKAGTVPGYSFSPAMAKSGVTWDKASLDKYVTDPQATVPGTKMIFLGIKDAGDRSALIDYLASLKG